MVEENACMQPSAGRAVASNRIGAMMAATLVLLALFLSSGCASTGFGEPVPVTVPQIIKMSREGTPASAIIEQMRKSGTVYRLQASQLGELHKQGVSDSVINYMQRTYVDAVRLRQEREDWSYWDEQDGWWYGGAPWGWADDDDYDRD
jgi:hypothetical protein